MTSSSSRRKSNDTASKAIRLGDLEAQVMDLLWEGNALTVRAIIDRLASQHAYTTIATVLSNLRKKQLVCTQKERHTTLYGACVSREEHATSLMEHALDTSGDRTASILHFVNNMPESDLRLLREHLLSKGEGES